MTLKVGDKVRTTLEGDRYYNRVGVVKRGTLDAHPHEYYLVAFDTVEEWYQVDLLELADTTTGHTAAVIEAARLVLTRADADAVVDHLTGTAWLELSETVPPRPMVKTLGASDSIPNTFSGALAMLRGAIDAYDESETP